ncbi:MAG TPA: CBS domain-containing protein [Candidatus Sulfotelmatobacter sp.]|nr:CBS domain-containing protein [Candidatus Sulfotelmatobacter sp.]
MKVREIMTKNPACCTPDTSLEKVAQLMCECDCGEIPIVDSNQTMVPIGVVTDRDITCRTIARGRNPLQLTAQTCMSTPAVTVPMDATVEQCCELMERNQIRRIPVVDHNGRCCGMVSQADLALHVAPAETGKMVHDISGRTEAPSLVGAR